MVDRCRRATVSLDRTIELLANQYRRRLLVTLLRRDPWDGEDPRGLAGVDAGAGEPGALEIRLHHSHLPKLEAAELIEWHRESNEVWKGPRFEEVRPLLETLDEHADELPGVWP